MRLIIFFSVEDGEALHCCFCSITLSCQTLRDPMNCSTSGFPVLHYLPRLLKLMFIESVMPSNHLILCLPLLLLPSIIPSIRVFSNELTLPIRWPKYRSFSYSISPSNEYLELISFRIDWFDLLAVPGILKILLNITIWKHQFFSAQPSLWSLHDYWKNHSFDYMDLCQQSDVSF